MPPLCLYVQSFPIVHRHIGAQATQNAKVAAPIGQCRISECAFLAVPPLEISKILSAGCSGAPLDSYSGAYS